MVTPGILHNFSPNFCAYLVLNKLDVSADFI